MAQQGDDDGRESSVGRPSVELLALHRAVLENLAPPAGWPADLAQLLPGRKLR